MGISREKIHQVLQGSSEALGVLPELAAVRPRFSLHVYNTLPSTNREAWHLIDGGHGAGTVVIAEQQTAGRGQRGRQWVSEPGGLYLSLVLEPDCAIADAALITCASAWGVAIALENLGIPLQLKWPNDFVSHGRKVGGILTESRLGRSSGAPQDRVLRQVVVGIGLNWQNPLPENGQSLYALLPDPVQTSLKSLEALAAIALRGIIQGYQYWQWQGTRSLMTAYEQKLHNFGKPVTIDGHSAIVVGVSLQGELAISYPQAEFSRFQYLKPGDKSLGYNV
jgi:BirA family biotin operon repressor/biotin-[acetyl-CoA-carboxylase] ligase